jgi:glycogen debranching enzyme
MAIATITVPAAASGAGEPDVPAGQIAQFFIPATASLHERRPRTLKHGDTFAVFDHNGDALSGPGSPEGLFHRDTRYLSHFYLTVGSARPILLSSTLRDDNVTLTCDLTNPDLYDENQRLAIEHDVIHIRRSRFLWNATCFERLVLKNFDVARRTVRIELQFAADFADIFEVRGTRRERRGEQHPAAVGEANVELSYTGLDRRRRTTVLQFEPAPTRLTCDKAEFELTLKPQEARSIFIEVRCGAEAGNQPPRRAFFAALRESRRALRQSSSRAAAIVSSNDFFNEAIRRSVSDLYMLVTDLPEGPYPYAGIPWFSTVFGRDALVTAWETLWVDPEIARGVLLHLAAHQATTIDPAADAEPGKILHEMRQSEMAELGEVPFRRYYGSIDATPLFVLLAGAYLDRTGDLPTLKRLWPHVEAALRWIDEFGDADGDGFVEYSRRTPEGLVNQGWKDSQDSVFHANGQLAEGPIALAEVQAYVYGALTAASAIAKRLGRSETAGLLAERAQSLRHKFDAAFFDADLGTYVLALDGRKRPCRVRTSNAGHALFTGIAFEHRAQAIVASLMDPRSFSGWGIRTVASSEARFNPMSYHNGSVWPHDNAIIAAGMARYGFRREAAKIFTGLFDASAYIDLRRLPELICGFARQRTQGPTLYPVACSPQAWAGTAPISLLQSCLGLRFEPRKNEIIFERPILPEFLDHLVLRHVSVGQSSADFACRRSGSQVVVEVLERRGSLAVIINV